MVASSHVASLHCYPVKSCRGIDLVECVVERRGFVHDRRFMVVDHEGHFRTQRTSPLLATVAVRLDGDVLHLSAAGAGEVMVDLLRASEGREVDAQVWRHRGRYRDQGDAPAAFFTGLLGSESRLVYMPDEARRRVNPKYAATSEDLVGFADGYPYLVTTTGSLRALEAEVGAPVPMARFRPNVVVDHAVPWDEDDWRALDVGAGRFAVTRPCTRCVVVNTDQRTGERSLEPLAALGRIRRVPGGVAFGTYVAPLELGATVRVGDPVAVRRAPRGE